VTLRVLRAPRMKVNVVERVPVAFAGPGSGVAELSWGQRDIWMTMVRQKNWLPMGGWKRLTPETTVQDVAEELRYLLSRFQSMRTRLRFDADGQPSQVLSDHGVIMLDVIEAADDVDLDVQAEAVKDWYQDTDYDYFEEWPVRMGVLRHDGVLTHLVVIMCHLVADGLGALVMLREVEARLTTPVVGSQSLEQARWQASPAGVRQHGAALRYWERILRSVPPRRFPGSTDRREPRHWRGDFTSPALRLATHAIADRVGADSSHILLTVFAVALARVTGVNPVVTRPMVSNRFRPGLADVVSMVAQYGLCALDVAGVPFAEALHRVRSASMTAYKHAYYDPAGMAALIERIAAERGPDFDIGSYVNDRRTETRQGFTGPVPTGEQIAEAARRNTFRWTIHQDDPFERLIVHIEDTPGAIHVVVFMDTHVVSPADGEGLVRCMEQVAIEAAADPLATAAAR
jgi:hypothetical protein